MTTIKGASHEGLRAFVIFRSFHLQMGNVLDKPVEEIKTHFVFCNYISKNRASCEIMWKNVVEPERPHVTIGYNSSALHAGYLRHQTHT